MNPIQDKLTDPSNTDDLNELVLEAAAVSTAQKIALETSPENARIVVLNETVEAGGHRLEVKPAESEKSISEQLVDAGNDEADLEQRVATVINKRAKE
jgi:hypothetical protein|uniref:hypothetical protein n=1 Tax=Prosthecobacter sp. TaxID=1965333 RepID=UPI0037850B26